MLPRRKPFNATPPTAVGYINRHRIPEGATPESVGRPIRAWAEEQGYRWGGTYLASRDDAQAVAALTRATARPEIEVVVVPNSAHLPAGQHVIVAGKRRTRVIAVR